MGERPQALSESEIKTAQRLMKNREHPIGEIYAQLGISRSTLYRYVAPDGRRRR